MLHVHGPTAIVLQVLLNRFIKRVLYISHGYKFPLNFAWRLPSPWGSEASTDFASAAVVTDTPVDCQCRDVPEPQRDRWRLADG